GFEPQYIATVTIRNKARQLIRAEFIMEILGRFLSRACFFTFRASLTVIFKKSLQLPKLLGCGLIVRKFPSYTGKAPSDHSQLYAPGYGLMLFMNRPVR
ncbi:hypothetical protein KA005_84195, partial [bacterium]|nr:hypothetical protein [bacterium]